MLIFSLISFLAYLNQYQPVQNCRTFFYELNLFIVDRTLCIIKQQVSRSLNANNIKVSQYIRSVLLYYFNFFK